jgi:hypothetical protein
MPGLATGNQPVNVGEVKTDERPQQRLGRDEADRRRHPPKIVGAADPALVLDRDAHPYVRGPLKTRCYLGEILMTLGQDLEGVMACLGHH